MCSAKTYKEIEATSDVMTASNHRLIQLLFDKCLYHLRQAEIKQKQNPKAASESLTKSVDIIIYLRACLSHSDEPSFHLAERLNTIYVFVHRSLVQLSLKFDLELLDKVKLAISNLKEGWDGIENRQQ